MNDQHTMQLILDKPGRGRVYSSILETIGNTPLVRINRFARQAGCQAEVLAKLEFFNPLASVKDRIAISMLEAMERAGTIGPGSDGRPRWLHGAAGLGDVVLKFVPVDDERIVKNRCHWDVTTESLDDLVEAGAAVVRSQDDEISWTVLRDPDGNEFCAFT